MTSLYLPSEHPLPADSQVDVEGTGTHSGEEEDYEQSAAAALLGMAAALPLYPLSEYSSGSAKRELEDPPQLSYSRGSSSDDLSSISSNAGDVKRQRAETKEHGGGPPPGTCRFQCKYPACMKMYSSTDAVRKHCRKRHLEWLRKLDLMAAHDRYLPKPALYCRWGSEADIL